MSSSHLMVVLIVAMALFASVLRARYAHQRRDQRQLAAENPENTRLRDEVKQLKERIAVLERITVEKENSLERQIEELRDR